MVVNASFDRTMDIFPTQQVTQVRNVQPNFSLSAKISPDKPLDAEPDA